MWRKPRHVISHSMGAVQAQQVHAFDLNPQEASSLHNQHAQQAGHGGITSSHGRGKACTSGLHHAAEFKQIWERYPGELVGPAANPTDPGPAAAVAPCALPGLTCSLRKGQRSTLRARHSFFRTVTPILSSLAASVIGRWYTCVSTCVRVNVNSCVVVCVHACL